MESAEFLKQLNLDLIKIASFDSTNLTLIKKCVDLFKNIIISTGMTSIKQIDDIMNVIKDDINLILLHCISSYPMDPLDAKLANIPILKKLYTCEIGYSDHSSSIEVPLYAIAAGANVIEKHFMLENDDCVDSSVSITKTKFKEMIQEGNRIKLILGDSEFGVRESEKNLLQFRRF